jgi:peroxiredoxin
MKFKPGDMLPTAVMEAVTGEAIHLPDAKRLVHLQFRRFVDCPICNTHITEFRKRATEIKAAGIKEVIVTYFEGNRLSRIRQCGNEGCSLFFDDATKNAKRRSCSVACFDRARARHRRKDQAP